MAATGARGHVVYVVGTYPLLTTTFIDREIELLRALGLDVDVTSLRRPTGTLSPEQERLGQDVRYVLPVSGTALVRSLLHFAVRRPGALCGTLLRLVTRPHPSPGRRLRTILHVGEGVHVAYLLRHGPVEHVHAHFVDRAAVVGMVAGRLLGCTYSATAHANDIYVDPILLLEKISRSAFTVTCTERNTAHLRSVVGPDLADRIVRLYHGLDVGRYQPADGRRPARVLAVGQLKEKKGLAQLIRACALLRDDGYALTCEIVGEGPLRRALEDEIARRCLDDIVTLRGALPHREVVEAYRAAAVFALPCTTGADGDRDGIPNVILEAMAMELPVVSTTHSGIPEAVVDGVTGLLVPPDDPAALASALARLLDDPELGARMGREGRQVVASIFDITTNAKDLLARFEEVMA